MKLEYEVDKGIGRITFSNPPQNRLISPVLEKRDRLVTFLSNDELRAAIITGEGRHFSAGADVEKLREQLADSPETLARELEEGKAALEAISFAPVPIVAMIRGSCLGAGLEIALACHFRVASENALLGFPEATLGLMPGLGGTILTPEVAHRSVAIDLMVSGKLLGAREAEERGLVDRVVPTRQLEEATRHFLSTMVGGRYPHVIRGIMTSIHNSRRLSLDDALRAEGRLFLEVARESLKARGEEEG